MHRIYIDEVGNPDLKSSRHEDHRYLCLAGLIFDLEYVKTTLAPELEKLKARYFDSHPDDLKLDDKKNTFSDKVLKIIEESKFFNYKGNIINYGLKKLP